MSTRGIIGAFAVLCAVEASLILPGVSSAHQLAETMTATGIHAQVHSMQKSNLLTPARRARSVAGVANQKRAEDAEAMGDGATAVNPSVQQNQGRGVDATSAAPFDEKNPVKGKSYSTDGVVVHDGVVNGQRVILVVRVESANKFQVLGFRLHDPTVPVFPDNSPVRVTGVYASKFKEPKTGTLVHGFDDAVVSSAAVASAAPAPDKPAEPEKATFDSIMKGWVFRGTVWFDGKATGVFVNSDKVKYAHVGTELEKDVRVASVTNGQARVIVAGQRFDVTPW